MERCKKHAKQDDSKAKALQSRDFSNKQKKASLYYWVLTEQQTAQPPQWGDLPYFPYDSDLGR
jgi:hypothetical protein